MRFIVSIAMHECCRWIVSHRLRVDIQGVDNVPRQGPVLIVSRHVHHLYDGVIYLSTIRRRVSILVALDWIPDWRLRPLMELACHVAGWPTVLREDRLRHESWSAAPTFKSAYAPGEARRYLRGALRQSVALLRRGSILVVFPEAYPMIDPMVSPRNLDADFLPFRRGFVHLVRAAQRDGATRVSVVPAGLCYEGSDSWRVNVRFGSALSLEEGQNLERFAFKVEAAVRELSSPREPSSIHARASQP